MSTHISDHPDKVAFKDGLGSDIVWGEIEYGDQATPELKAEFDAAYELVKNGHDDWFHTDGDLYQGTTLMRVIRRKADGTLFGFPYWQGGGKHGETVADHNGDDHGFPSKYDWEEGVDEDEVWYVFKPVEYTPIPAYQIKDN